MQYNSGKQKHSNRTNKLFFGSSGEEMTWKVAKMAKLTEDIRLRQKEIKKNYFTSPALGSLYRVYEVDIEFRSI